MSSSRRYVAVSLPGQDCMRKTRKTGVSLSSPLRSAFVFLSVVGVSFAIRNYALVKDRFGPEASRAFFDDMLLQLAVVIVANVLIAFVMCRIAARQIEELESRLQSLMEERVEGE